MIKTKEDLLSMIQAQLGDDLSDEALNLVSDITDTFDDLESKTKDATNWKEKYEQNDREWRQKYRDRFFKATGDDSEFDDDPEPRRLTYEDLFTTVKE